MIETNQQLCATHQASAFTFQIKIFDVNNTAGCTFPMINMNLYDTTYKYSYYRENNNMAIDICLLKS